MTSTEVESARREWEDAHRRLADARGDPRRGALLNAQLAAITNELRKRVGSTFTLGELADEYRRADAWTFQAVGGDELDPHSLSTLTYVEGAAFRLYARGAVDYEP
jgi:hypothetical protein